MSHDAIVLEDVSKRYLLGARGGLRHLGRELLQRSAQLAASFSRSQISVRVTPRLRMSAQCSGSATPLCGSVVTSLAIVSVTRLGISSSWNQRTSSGL